MGDVTRNEALRRVLFFKDLPDDVIAEAADAGHERRLAPGEMLFCEGDPCGGLLLPLSGSVKLFRLDARGREMILGVEGPGTPVGEIAVFDGGNYPMSATATEGGATVFAIAPERFRRLMAEHPRIAVGAVRALAVQNRKLIEMLKAQTLHTVRARIAAYLLHAADQSGGTFALRESNATIGSHVGTVREVVSRTLHSLEDQGAVTLHGRTVTVRDRALLARLAEQDG